MPRLPKKVSQYVHRNSGTTIDIRLDAKTGMFSAAVGGAQFENKDMEALKKQVGEFLDKSASVTWVPIIYYRVGHGYSSSPADIDIELKRFYAASGPDGKPLQARWETNGKALLSESKSGSVIPENLPFYPERFRRGGTTTVNSGYFAYTDELWGALTCLVDTCVLVRNLCLAALVDDNRVRLLTEFAGLLASQWPEYMPEAKKADDDDD